MDENEVNNDLQKENNEINEIKNDEYKKEIINYILPRIKNRYVTLMI